MSKYILALAALAAIAACAHKTAGTESVVKAAVPTIAGCQMFPQGAYSTYSANVSQYPVSPNSAAWLATYPTHLHANFGYAPGTGMPYNVVPANQPLSPITFTTYAKQSEPGPYPLPDPKLAKFEGPNGGPDHHLIVLQQGTCELYEMGRAYYTNGKWSAIVGVKWNTITGTPRPDNVTSADAAGTPILPGIITCADVASGIIEHAINVVIPEPTYFGYITPATHWNDEYTNPKDMPMGARLRIKESMNLATSGLTGQALIIATALQQYGGIVKDVGQTGFDLEGETGTCWNAKDLAQLDKLPVSDLEVVNTGPVLIPYPKGR